MDVPELLTGLIIRTQSGFFFVLLDGQTQPITCQLRGRLKQGRREGDIAAIGDQVLFRIMTVGQSGSGCFRFCLCKPGTAHAYARSFSGDC